MMFRRTIQFRQLNLVDAILSTDRIDLADDHIIFVFFLIPDEFNIHEPTKFSKRVIINFVLKQGTNYINKVPWH